MFTELINPIQPLTKQMLSFESFQGMPDYSLQNLHIALTKPRMSMELCGGVNEIYNSDALVKAIEETETKYPNDGSRVSFNYYRGSSATVEETVEVFSGLDFCEQGLLETFVSQKTGAQTVKIYIKPEINTAYVFVNTTSVAVYHLILSFYSKLFPKLFREKPCTEQETETLKSLLYKTPDQFISNIASLLKPYEKEIMVGNLKDCFTGFRERKIRQAAKEIEDARQSMEDCMIKYSTFAQKLEERTIYYEGLKTRQEDTDSDVKDLIDYIASSPNVFNVEYSENVMNFDARTLLINIDTEKWRQAVRTSSIYDYYTIQQESVFSQKWNRKKLLDALFGSDDPNLYVKVWGKISLNLNNAFMSVVRGMNTPADPSMNNHLENPHFSRHACPGRNRDQIQQCLARFDLVSAMECSIAAVGSVNIGETDITFRPFVQEILTSKNKIIFNREERKDMTPEEALLWLLEKEKGNASNQTDGQLENIAA